jgi:hypothetical protein
MELKIEITGIDKVRKLLDNIGGPGLRQAAADALNDSAFRLRSEMQAEMGRVFDRPTPYILRSVQVKKATAEKMVAEIGPTYMGGKGVDPEKILQAEVLGGRRRDKRSEVALRRVGILPAGYVTVIPKNPLPGSDDGRGNLRGPFITQLLSYLQAFGEQGYRANMTQKRKDKLANVGRSANGYKTINGVQYFVSLGELPGGKGVHDHKNRSIHLAPGVWARSGMHGYILRPVLMFVRAPTYAVRLSMEKLARNTDVQAQFEKRIRFRIRQAAGV